MYQCMHHIHVLLFVLKTHRKVTKTFMMTSAAAWQHFWSILSEQSQMVTAKLIPVNFLYHSANAVVCLSTQHSNMLPHNRKHQKLWRHKSNIMSHQTLDSVLSWPKYLYLPNVSVSPVLVIADNCQLDKVSFEGLTAAEYKSLYCCCKC